MSLLNQTVATGPLILDCLELHFDIDGHKYVHIKPDQEEMHRRYDLGQYRAIMRVLAPTILRKAKYARRQR